MRPFKEIVGEYGPMVLRVCRAVLDPSDAEDAWSETFLAALTAYPQLSGDANVEAWLVTIAHRKAIDSTRAAGRRPVTVAEPPEQASGTGTATPAGSSYGTPEDWAERADRDAELWAALRQLPPRQRTAVAYHYLAGLPYKEIATITGGSADAARRAAADGIRALRTAYGV